LFGVSLTSEFNDGAGISHDEDGQRNDEHEQEAGGRVQLFLPCGGVCAVSHALIELLDEGALGHAEDDQLQEDKYFRIKNSPL
jgi:hypothetical protein